MPDIGSAPGIYTARPVIKVAGTEQSALSDGLQQMTIEETADGMLRCEATLANWGNKDNALGYLYFDRSILDFGKSIQIQIGAGDAQGQVFDGRIMALEARFLRKRPPEILILAEDRLQDLRMTRRTRTFEDMSDSDVFRQVASGQGLQASVDVDGPTHKVLAQVNQSDLAFLRERARAVDAELWLSGTSLNVKARNRRQSGDVKLTLGQGLLEFSVIADIANQVTAFTVSGWDISAKDAISYEATDSALAGEVNGFQSGSSILSSAIADRKQQVVHRLPFTQSEAQGLAEHYYRATARRFVTGRGTCEGDARLHIGTQLELDGVGPLFQGKYYVSRVRHIFDSVRGFQTDFEVERPGIGQ